MNTMNLSASQKCWYSKVTQCSCTCLRHVCRYGTMKVWILETLNSFLVTIWDTSTVNNRYACIHFLCIPFEQTQNRLIHEPLDYCLGTLQSWNYRQLKFRDFNKGRIRIIDFWNHVIRIYVKIAGISASPSFIISHLSLEKIRTWNFELSLSKA